MDLPKRKSNRLKNWDYSSNGAYFITICTKDKQKIFWMDGESFCCPQYEISLSKIGNIVNSEINKIPNIYKNIEILKYVVMPNHIHMIINITGDFWRPQVAPTISRIIKQFKGSITKQIGISIWQRSYHDHIIRDEDDYLKIWQYIDENPLKWELDCFYI